MKNQNIKKYTALIIFLLISIVVEIMGSLWTNTSVKTWYPTLIKPSWTPPPWIFGPIWTILYILMAIAGWKIYLCPKSKMRAWALGLYAAQLFCNLIWTYLFFYLKSPLLGFIDIAILFLLIICLTVLSFKISKMAGYLLLPYLVWTGYALSLNAAIWFSN